MRRKGFTRIPACKYQIKNVDFDMFNGALDVNPCARHFTTSCFLQAGCRNIFSFWKQALVSGLEQMHNVCARLQKHTCTGSVASGALGSPAAERRWDDRKQQMKLRGTWGGTGKTLEERSGVKKEVKGETFLWLELENLERRSPKGDAGGKQNLLQFPWFLERFVSTSAFT